MLRNFVLYDRLPIKVHSVYTRRSSRRSVARPIAATTAPCKHAINVNVNPKLTQRINRSPRRRAYNGWEKSL